MKIDIEYTYSPEDIEVAVLAMQRSKFGVPPSGFQWTYVKRTYSDEATVKATEIKQETNQQENER
jgi:hypothetical protein